MSANKDGVPQPEMVNSQTYRNNFEGIDWRNRGAYCFVCGKNFGPEEQIRMKEDGHAECLNGCV